MDELLNEKTKQILVSISQTGEPYRQQAIALLALNEGMTQIEASRRSGLTARQVRYVRDKYTQKGMTIFPDEVLASIHLVQPKDSEDPGMSGWIYETGAPDVVAGSSNIGEINTQEIQEASPAEKVAKGKKGKKNKKQKKDKGGGKKKKKRNKKKGRKNAKSK